MIPRHRARKPHEASLRRALLRGTLNAGVICTGLAFGLGLSSLATPNAAVLIERPPASVPSQPSEQTATAARLAERTEALAERNHCWTESTAPQDVVPSKALVTLGEGGPHVVKADIGYDIWLEGRPGTLHAFCR